MAAKPADRLPVDRVPPFFVSQKSVVKVLTTAMDIATAIFGCLLSKWHLVTRLLGLGQFGLTMELMNEPSSFAPSLCNMLVCKNENALSKP
jgi:hypothetical protein